VFFNAGTIGGHRGAILPVLQQLHRIFCELNDDRNNNLLALNACLHMSYAEELLSKRGSHEDIPYATHLPTSRFSTSQVFSGFPLNSQFGMFEAESQAFVIHK
jgi:hypothetical protein